MRKFFTWLLIILGIFIVLLIMAYIFISAFFDTEPMVEANKGDVLDFSKCRPFIPPKSIETKKIPKDKIALAQKHLKSLNLKIGKGYKRLQEDSAETLKWKDDAYYQALEIMNGQDLEVGLKGKAKIVR